MTYEVTEMRLSTDLPFNQALALAFDLCVRQGTETDEPEGECFIKISGTLARRISQALRTGVWPK